MTHVRKLLNRDNLSGTGTGILLFVISCVINYQANLYAFRHTSNMVTDAFLDILPVVNVNLIFSEGSYLFLIFLLWAALQYPRRIAFLLKSLALFVLTRAIFISLTHLGPPSPHASLDGSFPRFLTAGSDLFFSGHTGIPFLMALIFWDDELLRIIFLSTSILAGAAVLLGHLHYSIDVFSAFFITHGVFLLAKKYFAGDYQHGFEKTA